LNDYKPQREFRDRLIESDTVSPELEERRPASKSKRKWTKDDIIALFEQGNTVEQVEKITGLNGRVIGGYKGFLKSPIYSGPPVRVDNGNGKGKGTQGKGPQGKEGGVNPAESKADPMVPRTTPADGPQVLLEAGPGEAQALAILLGKPYLIQVRNVYVSPDALKCYQVLVAKGFRGSVGDFFELCVLKCFKEIYGLVPAMIRPQEVPQ
jgi:hypothetical protein